MSLFDRTTYNGTRVYASENRRQKLPYTVKILEASPFAADTVGEVARFRSPGDAIGFAAGLAQRIDDWEKSGKEA